MINCSACGTIVPSAMSSCPRCGATVDNRLPIARPSPSGPGDSTAAFGVVGSAHAPPTAPFPGVPVTPPKMSSASGADWAGPPAVASHPLPGMPGAPVAMGPAFKGGWTGIPGVVAFGVSIICLHAWGLIIYGGGIAFLGNMLSGFANSSSDYCDYWDEDCISSSGAINDVILWGLGLAALGVLLLIAVIALMRGNRAGQVVCGIAEGLLIIGSIGVGADAESARFVVIAAALPVTALICIVSGSANRFINAAEAAARAGLRR